MYDLRHTFATWLEDAGIAARVIDEVMGDEASGRTRSSVAAPWARTTGTPPRGDGRPGRGRSPARLTVVLQAAESSIKNEPNRALPGDVGGR